MLARVPGSRFSFASLAFASVACVAAPAFAGDLDAARYQRCILQIAHNADAALEAARSWEAEGGGGPAGHCEALALIRLKRPGEAAVRLQKLASANGDYGTDLRAQMYDQAGNAWLLAGEPGKAVPAFSAAIDLARAANLDAGTMALYYGDRARAYLLAKNNAGAQSDLDRSIALAPSAQALTLHARVRRMVNDDKTASADIARALALNPSYPEAFLERGRLRERAGDAKGARDDFLKAAMLQKDGGVADEARQALGALDIKRAK